MNLYIDSSAVLRIVLSEPSPLLEWTRVERGFASEIIRLECLRTIDRARILRRIPDSAISERRAAVLEVLAGFELVPLDELILLRASEPFPTMLGSLDAIHLATALFVRERIPDVGIATHDSMLAVAARAVGFDVFGATAG